MKRKKTQNHQMRDSTRLGGKQSTEGIDGDPHNH